MQCITPPTLVIPQFLTVCAQITDPRTRRGQRYPLASLLTGAVAAILAQHTSVLAIAEWVADRTPAQRRALGFRGTTTPHQTTFARLFRRLDPTRLAQLLLSAFQPRTAHTLPQRGQWGVSVDGKAHRGRIQRTTQPGWSIHAVSIVDHLMGVILAHAPVHQPTSEAMLATTLLPQIDWTGRVVTDDAAYCTPAWCAAVRAHHGDYLVTVKRNQPTLLHDIQWLLADPPALTDYRTATVLEHGHGRRTIRTIQVSSDLAGSSRWPGIAQAFAITRQWWDRHGTAHEQTTYGITSLPASAATARRLLERKQGHWVIENGVHSVKDMSLGEDASAVHRDAGPQVMAILRDAALNCLRITGERAIAAALRRLSRNPAQVFHLLGIVVSENA